METLAAVLAQVHDQLLQHVPQAMLRLVIAGALGGLIGLERETKGKPAGLRTNMFICFGAALFTIASDRLATAWTGDHVRIAAQIIPGIGFIGAGSILQSRGSVTGLTTAATMFVVAAVGMAVGGGLYLIGVFATAMLVAALLVLGWAETHFDLKRFYSTYEVFGTRTQDIIHSVAEVLSTQQRTMQDVVIADAQANARMQFTVEATRHQHKLLNDALRRQSDIERVESFGFREHE